jgi:hypothetical protein
MKLIVLFILISFKVLSQNYEPSMKFDYDFMFDARLFKNLTEDYFTKERKKLKIKEIKIVVHGSESLDSIYLNNKIDFKKKLNDVKFPFPVDHSFYSYIKIYRYNYLGELISYEEYPICNYLTSEDSLQFSKRIIKTLEIGNQIIISKMNKDTIYEQLTYKNEQLISKFYRKELNISKYDSSSKTYISKLIRTNELFKYTYLNDGKLSEISVNDKLILKYKYPSKIKTIITNYQFDENPDYNQVSENVIMKNNQNKVISSLFYQPSFSQYKMGYNLEYDMYGNLVKVIETEFEEKKYEDKHIYQEYTNTYENNKLVRTFIPKKYLNLEYDITYEYNEIGIIKTMNKWNKTHYFEYAFFD